MNSVSLKIAFVVFTIRQSQFTKSLLGVAYKGSFIVSPLLVQHIKVCVIESSLYGSGLVVINFTVAMELIDEPVPLIGEIMVGVEQLAKAVHIVFLPVSIVVAPLLVVELALAVTHAIKFLALVPAPIFVLLNSILLILVFASGLLAELGYDRDRVDGMDLVIGVDGVLVMFLVIRSNFVRIE
jgi:hypothetical protein